MTRKLFFLTAMILLPAVAWGAPVDARCGTPASQLDSSTRAAIWMSAIDDFIASNPDLTVEQQQVLWRSPAVGMEIQRGFGRSDERSSRSKASAQAFMAEAKRVFSQEQLAELFSSMGTLQQWLILQEAFVESTPYCNCTGQGSCQFEEGTTGICEDGCISRTGSDGVRRDGICSGGTEIE